jgi:hypothetical protein
MLQLYKCISHPHFITHPHACKLKKVVHLYKFVYVKKIQKKNYWIRVKGLFSVFAQ